MRIFLTGGTGYLGSHVARAFVEAGHEVVALVRDPDRAAPLADLGIVLVPGDLLEPETWKGAIRGSRCLVHIAALVAPWARDPRIFRRVNVDGTLSLVDHALAVDTERVLVASSFFVLGPSSAGTVTDERMTEEPASPLCRANAYVHSKRLAAEALWDRQREGRPITMLYPTILVGPGAMTAGNHTASVIADIGRRRFPGLIGNGEQIWNLVPVESAARGFVDALEHGPRREDYILGGENWTQRRFVEQAGLAFGHRPPLRRLGRALPLGLAWLAERWAGFRNTEPLLTRGVVRLYDADWAFSSEKASRELGYRRGNVLETIEATVSWLEEEVWAREARARGKSPWIR